MTDFDRFPTVVMYATATCPFCIRALHLLKQKNIPKLDIKRVDLEPDLRAEMIKVSGRRTVPQIFVGDYHVGGSDELLELELDGELDALLRPHKD